MVGARAELVSRVTTTRYETASLVKRMLWVPLLMNWRRIVVVT